MQSKRERGTNIRFGHIGCFLPNVYANSTWLRPCPFMNLKKSNRNIAENPNAFLSPNDFLAKILHSNSQ